MTNYWSCSKLANLIRGKNKLEFGTSKEWENWRVNSKKSHAIRFWMAETALDSIQDFLFWPFRRLYDVKYYFNNRFVTKTHQLTAKSSHLQRGQWADLGNRFLPCLFDELVDFVEVEKAWLQITCNDDAKKKYAAPWWSHGIFRWRTWRSAEAGVDHLIWESKLSNDDYSGVNPEDKEYGKPTQQAIAASEILFLYTWWKEVYTNRPDPMDVTGWSEYCNTDNGLRRETKPEDRKRVSKMLSDMRKLEAKYDKEDTEMLVRLIKVRQTLWT